MKKYCLTQLTAKCLQAQTGSIIKKYTIHTNTDDILPVCSVDCRIVKKKSENFNSSLMRRASKLIF